jgi:hypothetical protein
MTTKITVTLSLSKGQKHEFGKHLDNKHDCHPELVEGSKITAQKP